jgi:sec-independent protein translocase protein TatA
MNVALALLDIGFGEMVLIGIIALLIYGSDLPEVARTWGKTYQEFRRHLNGIRGDLNDAIYAEPEQPRKLQYYPEYQDDARESLEGEAEAVEHDSPVARAHEQAEAEAARLAATESGAEAGGDAEQVQDAHGAA